MVRVSGFLVCFQTKPKGTRWSGVVWLCTGSQRFGRNAGAGWTGRFHGFTLRNAPPPPVRRRFYFRRRRHRPTYRRRSSPNSRHPDSSVTPSPATCPCSDDALRSTSGGRSCTTPVLHTTQFRIHPPSVPTRRSLVGSSWSGIPGSLAGRLQTRNR